MSELNIYQKIIEIRKTIDVFHKDTAGYKYKYVSGTQVLSKIKSKMDELGVILQPSMGSMQHEKDGKNYIVSGDMTYVWINAEKPEDRAEVTWKVFGQQDDISKAFGSALTYSERYFLLKYFGVPTDDEDPDTRQGDTPNYNNPNTGKPATSKQVGLLKTVVKKVSTSRNTTDDQVYEEVKKRLGSYDDITKISSQYASKAIDLVNGWLNTDKTA